MQNIADLTDPADPLKRTYREINNARTHKFAAWVLVEVDDGVRLFIAKQTRDCDGTPLYSLAAERNGDIVQRGYSEDHIKFIACEDK